MNHSLWMCERVTGRVWSLAQYAGTADRCSFRMLDTRHSLFDVGGKARSKMLTSPKIWVSKQCMSTCSPAAEIKPPPIDCKQSPTFHLHLFVQDLMSLIRNLALDPYTYTSGRWLKQDKLERESRYIHFDFAAFCEKAVELCSEATRVVRYEKKKEASTDPLLSS